MFFKEKQANTDKSTTKGKIRKTYIKNV